MIMKSPPPRLTSLLVHYRKALHRAPQATLLCALALVPFVSSLQAQEVGQKPNIILFYADDLGNGDIGYNSLGSRYARTPGIDRLFKQGIYLSNYLTHSMCSPSRAGLLTGRHYTEVGSALNVGGNLDNSVINIAKDLQANGYYTGAF
jgi:arylsulfatase A-like enzyme